MNLNRTTTWIQKLGLILLLASLSLLTTPARAHSADIFNHRISIAFTPDGLQARWEIIPGPLVTPIIWEKADTNGDATVSASESSAWAKDQLDYLNISLDDQPLPLSLESITWPEAIEDLRFGESPIVIEFSGIWPSEPAKDSRFQIDNTFPNSLHWYSISTRGGQNFDVLSQEASLLRIRFSDAESSTSAWESGRPVIPGLVTAFGLDDLAEQASSQSNQQQGVISILDGLMRNNETSPLFYFSAFSLALILGALHALSPGHGKTVVAAYLVGASGKITHALALGSIVTLTHTGSVFALGLATLAASSYFLPTDIFPFLELISGLLILILGLGLLAPRLRDWFKKRLADRQAETLVRREVVESNTNQERLVLNQPITERGPAHSHNLENGGTIPRGPIIGSPLQAITWRSLITLGVSGGLVPCPDAIAILLIAVTINRIGFGLSLIVSFSLGLAVVLIVIGLLIVQGRRLFERLRWFDRVAYVMPIVSALIVIGLGTALTVSTVKNLPPELTESLSVHFQPGVPVWSEMEVVYVGRDADGLYQLFAQHADDTATRQITQTPHGVADFTTSPDQTKVFYAAQDPMLATSLWEYDIQTGTHIQLLDCSPDYCNAPVQAPGGQQLIYERLANPADDTSLGITTLWWLEPRTGETGAVFGDSGLPGVVPGFSASGRWLSYASVYPNIGRFFNLSTGESIELPLGSDLRIQWHPSEDLALYVREVTIGDTTLSKVYRFDPAAGTCEQLLEEDVTFDESLPTWSPDGSTIALVRDDLRAPDEIGDQIWLLDVSSGKAEPLTTAPDTLHRNLSWSADGQALLFQSTDLNNTENPFVVQVFLVKSGETLDVTVSGLEPTWIVGE